VNTEVAAGITLGLTTVLAAGGRWAWARWRESRIERATPLPPASSRPRILLVEDQESGAIIVQAVLSATYHVDVAPTLAEARGLLRRYPYELLILDRRMPDGNGLDLATESRPRVLAYLADGREVHGPLPGVDVVLTKRGDIEELKRVVDALVHRRKVPAIRP